MQKRPESREDPEEPTEAEEEVEHDIEDIREVHRDEPPRLVENHSSDGRNRNVVAQQVGWWKIWLVVILIAHIDLKCRVEMKDSKSCGRVKRKRKQLEASSTEGLASMWYCVIGARTGVG